MATTNQPLVLQEQRPDAAQSQDLRPARPPVELPASWLWLGWAFAAALLGLAAWLWFRRRQRPVVPTLPAVPPHIRARRLLEEARANVRHPERCCTLASLAVRQYLEDRFRLPAPERTTEEFWIELSSAPVLTLEQKTRLAQVLEKCDLAKFAKEEPTETTLLALCEEAERLVDETWLAPDPQPQGPENAKSAA